jgi:eukaryotic-like serine/threonine-protein kinase
MMVLSALMIAQRDPLTILPVDAYKDVEMIAFGGTGRVYRARHIASGKLVALKVISLLNEEMLKRVEREIRLIANIPPSQNLVKLIDTHSSNEPPISILVMEWVDGTNLQNLVKACGAGVPHDIGAAIARQLCIGVGMLHDQGLVHRDIKPSNVLLAANGKVKLGDYGLIISAEDDEPITREFSIAGTLLYLAPEVLEGSVPDHKSDVYALGLTILFMLLGDLPMFGNSFSASVQMIVQGEVINHLPKTLPTPWRNLLLAMLDRNPSERLGSIQLAFDMLTKISPAAAPGADEKRLEAFLKEHGSTPSLSVIEPPRALPAVGRTDTFSSVPALVQSLAGQVAQFESSLKAITMMISRRDVERSKQGRL